MHVVAEHGPALCLIGGVGWRIAPILRPVLATVSVLGDSRDRRHGSAVRETVRVARVDSS